MLKLLIQTVNSADSVGKSSLFHTMCEEKKWFKVSKIASDLMILIELEIWGFKIIIKFYQTLNAMVNAIWRQRSPIRMRSKVRMSHNSYVHD